MIDSALSEKLKTLEENDGVSLSDVKVIVSNISQNRNPEDNKIKDFFVRNHPGVNIKVNFEMEGLEAPVVILIRNGGQLGHAISLGVSRATTKLIIMSPDDSNIMDKAEGKGVIKRLDTVTDPRSAYDHVNIPEDSDKSRWSVIGSALHSIYKSTPVYLQKVLKDHLDNQPR